MPSRPSGSGGMKKNKKEKSGLYGRVAGTRGESVWETRSSGGKLFIE